LAIYSLSMSNVSRASGSSACATLAYISGEEVYDERLGQSFKYGREERIQDTGVLLPAGAPAEFKDAKALFNSIETYEKSENARTAKKIIVALPRELDFEGQRHLLQDFMEKEFASRGYASAYAIHEDPDGNNPHAHILVANRQIDAETGEWVKVKTRKIYALDENGERIPVIDPETGAQKIGARGRKIWKRVSVQVNPLDEKKTLEHIRASWAKEANSYLEIINVPPIDHRSHEARGLDTIPTVHEGYAARAMHARGEYSDRIQLNQDIKNANKEINKINEFLTQIRQAIKNLVNTIKNTVRTITTPRQPVQQEQTRTSQPMTGNLPSGLTSTNTISTVDEEKAVQFLKQHYTVQKYKTPEYGIIYSLQRGNNKPEYVRQENIVKVAESIEQQVQEQRAVPDGYVVLSRSDTDKTPVLVESEYVADARRATMRHEKLISLKKEYDAINKKNAPEIMRLQKRIDTLTSMKDEDYKQVLDTNREANNSNMFTRVFKKGLAEEASENYHAKWDEGKPLRNELNQLIRKQNALYQEARNVFRGEIESPITHDKIKNTLRKSRLFQLGYNSILDKQRGKAPEHTLKNILAIKDEQARQRLQQLQFPDEPTRNRGLSL